MVEKIETAVVDTVSIDCAGWTVLITALKKAQA